MVPRDVVPVCHHNTLIDRYTHLVVPDPLILSSFYCISSHVGRQYLFDVGLFRLNHCSLHRAHHTLSDSLLPR